MNTILILALALSGDCYAPPVHKFTYNHAPKLHYQQVYQYPATFGHAAFYAPYSYYLPTEEDQLEFHAQNLARIIQHDAKAVGRLKGAKNFLSQAAYSLSSLCPDEFQYKTPSHGGAAPPAISLQTPRDGVDPTSFSTCIECHQREVAPTLGGNFAFDSLHDLSLLAPEIRRKVVFRLTTPDESARMPKGGDPIPMDELSRFWFPVLTGDSK